MPVVIITGWYILPNTELIAFNATLYSYRLGYCYLSFLLDLGLKGIMSKILCLILLLLTVNESLAKFDIGKFLPRIQISGGDKVGNGGDAMVCRSAAGKIIFAEFLDVYEARELRDLEVSLTGVTWREKLSNALERIKVRDQYRYIKYKTWSDTFWSETKLLEDGEKLQDIPDSNHVFDPGNGCGPEQAVVHREPLTSREKRYFLDFEIWQALDETNKALLVLHEMIYREAVGYGIRNSIYVRLFNSYVGADVFAKEQLSDKEYIELIVAMNFPVLTVRGTDIFSCTANDFDQNGRLLKAHLFADNPHIGHLGVSSRSALELEYSISQEDSFCVTETPFNVIFHQLESNLLRIDLKLKTKSVSRLQVTVPNLGLKEISLSKTWGLQFYKNGQVKDATFVEDTPWGFGLHGKGLCASGSSVRFYQNGRVARCELAKQHVVYRPDNSDWTCARGEIFLDENGYLRGCHLN